VPHRLPESLPGLGGLFLSFPVANKSLRRTDAKGFTLNRIEFSIIVVNYFTRRKEDSKSSGKNVIVLGAIKHESIRR
jgi:hypothetical protein